MHFQPHRCHALSTSEGRTGQPHAANSGNSRPTHPHLLVASSVHGTWYQNPPTGAWHLLKHAAHFPSAWLLSFAPAAPTNSIRRELFGGVHYSEISGWLILAGREILRCSLFMLWIERRLRRAGVANVAIRRLLFRHRRLSGRSHNRCD